MKKIVSELDSEILGNNRVINEQRKTLFCEMVGKTGSNQSVLDRLMQEIEYLRQQLNSEQKSVAMLRDALEITHELYVQSSTGYGFARPDNPHNFYPDIDCCSKEEIEAHSKACDDYSSGRNILNCSWGIGTYCDEYVPAIKALAATSSKEQGE